MKFFLKLALVSFIIGAILGVSIAHAQTFIVANRSNVDHEGVYANGLGIWSLPVKAHTVVSIPVNGEKTANTGAVGTTAYGMSGGLPTIGPGEYWYLEIQYDNGQYNGPVTGYTYLSSNVRPTPFEYINSAMGAGFGFFIIIIIGLSVLRAARAGATSGEGTVL